MLSTVDVELIELTYSEGNPLRIWLWLCRSYPGIFVYCHVPGSVADDCKLIHPRECVLEANEHDLQQASIGACELEVSQREGERERGKKLAFLELPTSPPSMHTHHLLTGS